MNNISGKAILVISGPSGCGKGTVVDFLHTEFGSVQRAISATTRKPRKGEKDGREYYFVSKEEFESKIEDNELMEHTKYVGNYYGTLHSEIEKIVGEGKICLLEIEVEGAQNAKRCYPDCTTIFILPPSEKVLEQRLRGRGTESDEVIASRLAIALKEMKHAAEYDFTVVNDKAKDCAKEIYNIIKARQV